MGAREVPAILLDRKPRIVISCGVYGNENRVRASAGYAEAVRAVGGVPLYAPAIFDAREWVEDLLGVADGVLLTGGGDVDPGKYGQVDGGKCSEVSPVRDEVESLLVMEAVARGVPVLGICRGAQLINVALGGSLCQDIASTGASDGDHNHDLSPETEHEPVHPVSLSAGSLVGRSYGSEAVSVNSMHHQCLDDLGEGLMVSAVAPDSSIEAVELENGWLVGVQWHPERMFKHDRSQLALFESFVTTAAGSRVGVE